MIPQIAAWGKTMIDGALGAAGTNAAAVGFDKLGNVGILYHGLATLGGGATLAASSSARSPSSSSSASSTRRHGSPLAGAFLTFFGFIHGEEIGVAQSPIVAIGYLGVAAMLFGFARYAEISPAAPQPEHGHGEIAAQPAE